ncbi:MAG: 2-oxoacid:acceptor oxidoreductase subunit alpha [Gammaproteobacteria bacterium]|nr:2-oxoacid:acceptor oxidoreductase subunit alpha [Gammaproteobacteria bacterium]
MTTYNEFVIRFANVNGSGSASANGMFAKSLFRMGIPVATRNIFPSNIQGLPTWFEVRISERGHFGRREDIDIMVAMNAETYEEDVACLRPGGYLVYDNTRGRPRSLQRSDIVDVGIPITKLILPEFSDPKQRQLFKNIVYLGAMSALLNIDFSILTGMVSSQYRGKDALIKPNIHAMEIGRNYAYKYLDCPFDMQVRHSELAKGKIFVDGNESAAIGAVYGGATVCAWYPITPSTSVAEAFEKHALKLRTNQDTGRKNFAVIQAEDELAALGMVIGAGWNGARAFTATSGPGISLMNEFLGLAYFAEIPAVLFDIQRAGPSTGMPTRTQQSDLLSVAFASHGDTRHPMLFPSSPKECFDFASASFDISERIQSPVVVMSDLDLGMNEMTSDPFDWEDGRKYDRGKVMSFDDLEESEAFGRYVDSDGDGIGYRTLPGTHPSKGSFFTRGTSRDEYAVYTEAPEAYSENMDRLVRKWETIRELMPKSEIYEANHRAGILFYGTSATPMKESLDMLYEEGVELDTLRIRSFPFGHEVQEFIDSHSTVFLVEQNRDAQMKTLIVTDLNVHPDQIQSILYYGGMSISADFIVNAVLEAYERDKLPRLREVSS